MIHVGWTQIVPDLTWFQQEAQPKVHGHHLRPRSAYGKFIGILQAKIPLEYFPASVFDA
jgi:hypothetical protein